ncbi:MAG: Uma2 family endonuclease [Kofleriaceae bacterium]
MRALLLEPDPAWLDDRCRKGLDKFDEVWDGVLHVVPFPSTAHQRVVGALYVVFRQLAERHRLEAFEHFGIYHPVAGERNFRGPDLLIVDPPCLSRRGVEGRAELVVEILSPNDESREKFPFFAQCQIPEVWLIDPSSRAVEVYVLRDDNYERVAATLDGTIHAPRLSLELRRIEGPKLRITWDDGSADV